MESQVNTILLSSSSKDFEDLLKEYSLPRNNDQDFNELLREYGQH